MRKSESGSLSIPNKNANRKASLIKDLMFPILTFFLLFEFIILCR